MAPECFQSGETSVATDTYALGVTAYFVLVGQHPFEGSAHSIMHGHLHREPPRPSSIQPALGPLVDEALLAPLAKDPAHRPASANAFVARLETAARTEELQGWRRREWPRRAVIAAAVAGLVVALVPFAMGFGVLGDLHRRSIDARLRMLGPGPADPRLRFVVLDDASLEGVATPLGSREMADALAERLEGVFASGARAVAIDMLLPLAWSRSEAFSQFVLRHQDALTLAAHVSPEGQVVGPEVLQGLTAVALGPDALRGLFGLVNIEADVDGVVRRARLAFRTRDGQRQEAWAAHAVRRLRGAGAHPFAGPDEPFWIDCSADWKGVERVAWKDVAERLEREPSFFAGTLVFVGGDLAGSGDEGYRVGSGLDVPGVLVQAMTANTILRGFPIREPASGRLGRLALWLGLSCLAFLSLAATRPWRVASLAAALALIYVAACFVSFPFTRTLVPVVSPAVQAAFVLLGCFLLRRNLSAVPHAAPRRTP